MDGSPCIRGWALSVLLCCLAIPVVDGATLIVDPSGEGDQTDTQAGIDAAVSGDAILVRAGTYEISAPIRFHGKAIVVRSELGFRESTIRVSDNPSDPAEASVVVFESADGRDSILEGFTLSGGSGSSLPGGRFGGAVLCRSGASPVLRDCRMILNDTGTVGDGGAIACFASSPRIERCTIARNRAGGGAGVLCAQGSSATLVASVIQENTALLGGGILAAEDRQ